MNHKSRRNKVTFIIQDAPSGVHVQVLFDPAPDRPLDDFLDPDVDADMHLETLVGAQRVGVIFIRGLLEQGVELEAHYEDCPQAHDAALNPARALRPRNDS
jgi:hypothetical protein